MSIYRTTTKATVDNLKLETDIRETHNLELGPPSEFGGDDKFLSPEDLFSASISSCYILTFKVLSKIKKLDWRSIDVTANAKLEKTDSGFRFTEVEILPVLTICCESDADPFIELLHKSKDNCLVTKSMNCEFILKPKVIIKAH